MQCINMGLCQMGSFILVLSGLLLHVTKGSLGKPEGCSPCTCIYTSKHCEGLKVNCFHLNLTKVPDSIPQTVVCLNLSYNAIRNLSTNAFNGFAKLMYLDLSYNKLSGLMSDTFKSLKVLKSLRIEHNSLHLDHDHVSADAFRGLSDLRTLRMQGNPWKNHPMSTYRDDIFQHLHSLEFLALDGLANGTNFTPGFGQLRTLRTIEIFGHFNFIANGTFKVFSDSQVQTLIFRSKKLYDLEPLAFKHFKNLTQLSLSFNHRLGFVNASKAWYGLQFTQIKELYLVACHPVDKSIIGDLTETFYQYLNKTALCKLFLDRNDIAYIENPRFHENLPSLEVLSLSHNRLQKDLTKLFADLYKMENLKTISLSHQLRSLHYEDEDIYEEHSLRSMSKQKTRKPILLPPNLEYFYMIQGYNYEQPVIRDIKVLGTKKLKCIDLSENQVNAVTGPVIVQYPTNMTWTIMARSNGLHYMDPEFLSEAINAGLKVEVLDLYDNKLGEQLSNDEAGKVFSAYKHMKVLNLSTNGLKSLTKNAFKNLIKVEALNLSSNSLRSINFSLHHMVNLKILDLSSNLYASLSEDEFESLDKIVEGQNVSVHIDLTYNPLVCSCETLPFLEWINKQNKTSPETPKVIIKNAGQYECAYEGQFVTLKEVFCDDLKYLKLKCSANIYVKAAASAVSTVFLIIVVAIFVYRNRWDIKFFVIRFIAQGRKEYAGNIDRERFEFDAFVAYHEDDRDWVREQLIPNLEKPPGAQYMSASAEPQSSENLRLCLHFRDFDGGTPITENIVEGITNSRKTILVLSRSFVESRWCQFETEIARMKCFDEGINSIIVVMLQNVELEEMTGSLRALIRRYSFLAWPYSPSDEDMFWKKLREAIINQKSMPSVCECGRVAKNS